MLQDTAAEGVGHRPEGVGHRLEGVGHRLEEVGLLADSQEGLQHILEGVGQCEDCKQVHCPAAVAGIRPLSLQQRNIIVRKCMMRVQRKGSKVSRMSNGINGKMHLSDSEGL